MTLVDTFAPQRANVLQTIKRHTSDITSCDFGPNLYFATGSGDKTVVVWEWKKGLGFVETTYSPLLGHKYSVTCVRFAPKGPVLASSSRDGHTMLWHVKTGKCLHSLVQSGGNGIRICAFSSDSAYMTTGGEGGTLCLWQLSNFSLIRSLDGHNEESVQGASFSPDSILLVSGDVTGSFIIWDIRRDDTLGLSITRDAHDLGVNYLEFSSHFSVHTREDEMRESVYLLGSCGNDNMIGLWQVSLVEPIKVGPHPIVSVVLLTRLSGHFSDVSSIRFSPDSEYIASTSIDKNTRIWEVSSGKCLKTLEKHKRYVACCAFSRDQKLIATGSNDKSVVIWDLTGDIDLDTELIVESKNLLRVQSAGSNGTSSNEPVTLLVSFSDLHTASINSCHFSSNLLVTASSDRKVGLFTWQEGEVGLKQMLDGHRYAVNQVEFSPDGNTLASASLDGTVILRDSETGELLKSGFHVSGSSIRCVRFSPDSTLIAVGGDHETVSVYRADTCELIEVFPSLNEGVNSLAFTPDSNYLLAGAGDGHCRLFCVTPTSSTPVLFIENAHDLGVTSSDFSLVLHATTPGASGRYELATCGVDCLVKVWNINTTEKTYSTLWSLSGHGGSVSCVRFSFGLSELIASCGTDKTCRLWDSYSGECLHVLNHEGVVTSCAFSPDSTLLATGTLDSTLSIWELPRDLAFQSFVASRVRTAENPVVRWGVNDVNKWLEDMNLPPSNMNGATLLKTSPSYILDQLNIEEDEIREELKMKLSALKLEDPGEETPHHFLCPITHNIMRDPVVCQDGYNYERCAIESWFLSGHTTSPMTNSVLSDLTLEANLQLRSAIASFLNKPSSSS